MQKDGGMGCRLSIQQLDDNPVASEEWLKKLKEYIRDTGRLQWWVVSC